MFYVNNAFLQFLVKDLIYLQDTDTNRIHLYDLYDNYKVKIDGTKPASLEDEMEILNLTFAGHQALATIRNPVIHEKAKNEWLSKVQDGLVSASAAQFVSVAAGILKNALLS